MQHGLLQKEKGSIGLNAYTALFQKTSTVVLPFTFGSAVFSNSLCFLIPTDTVPTFFRCRRMPAAGPGGVSPGLPVKARVSAGSAEYSLDCPFSDNIVVVEREEKSDDKRDNGDNYTRCGDTLASGSLEEAEE